MYQHIGGRQSKTFVVLEVAAPVILASQLCAPECLYASQFMLNSWCSGSSRLDVSIAPPPCGLNYSTTTSSNSSSTSDCRICAMRPDGPRDPVAGPDSGPEPPFPLRLGGEVIKGFGRGGKEVGIGILYIRTPYLLLKPQSSKSLDAYGQIGC
jgi:hypothetical protein